MEHPPPRRIIEDLRNTVDKAQRIAQVPSDHPAMVDLKRIIEAKIDALESEASDPSHRSENGRKEPKTARPHFSEGVDYSAQTVNQT
jgi:hypothetical protein